MKIRVYNDGKEKWQSFEAWSKEFDFIDAGYGQNEAEAVQNFKNNVLEMHNKVTDFYMSINFVEPEIEHVNNFLDK